MGQRVERALEGRHRLPVGGAFEGSRPSPVEMDDGLVPDLALGVVKTEREVVRLQPPFMEGRERLRYTAVKYLMAGNEDAAIRHLAHPIVSEVQTLAHAVQHAPADQLLHSPRRLLLAKPGDALEQSELELAPDDGGLRHQLTAPLVEASSWRLMMSRTRSGSGSPSSPGESTS
jgi:hypothetical protein